ncbi:hypothetical protein MKY59_21110 [Paenibacillus sp. FSL W8-0426]|uniref:hypothetical protein n=1 Tax=Paenibacillus sp. FSL W8-0426 TaxID=2921714 RepID=UPI0030DC3328
MNTLEQLNEKGLLSNEDKELLKELAKGTENILVIGNDVHINGMLLMTILRERRSNELGWYFKDRDDLEDFRNLVPNFTVLNSSMVKSYLDARELVRSITSTPIVIDEINTHAMAKFYLECCVGLRDQVTAAYTGYGDARDLLNSFAQLTRPTDSVDHRTDKQVIDYVRETLNIFVTYSKDENGQTKITVVDNRRQQN